MGGHNYFVTSLQCIMYFQCGPNYDIKKIYMIYLYDVYRSGPSWFTFFKMLYLYKISYTGKANHTYLVRRQAIIWTNYDPVYWRIYAALGGDELIS